MIFLALLKQREAARLKEEAQKREAIKLQAEQVLKKQQNLLKSKEAPKPDPNTNRVPPQRPRSRPQGSPTKEPFSMNLDSAKFEKPASNQNSPFVADFGSNFSTEKSTPKPSPNIALTADLNAVFENKSKKPPPRPSAPSAGPPRPTAPSLSKKEDASKKATEETKKVNYLLCTLFDLLSD